MSQPPIIGALSPRPQRVRRGDRLEFRVFLTAYRFFARLPRDTALRAGAALGSAFYLCDRPHRRIALRNLEIAFPEKSDAERRDILHCACRNLGRTGAEICHFERLTPETVGRYVRIEDPDRWRRELAAVADQGAIILTGHFGNFELLAYAHGLFGHPVTLVHRSLRNSLVDAVVTELRNRAGTRSIRKKAAAREALRALQRRELVAIPADQNQTRRTGVFVRFFGVPASTTPGVARLAMLTGAPVYPVFLVREGETDQHRLVVLPRVDMVRGGDRDADVVENTQRCTSVIEQMLRQYPEQWIWFHKRWRTRPPGEPAMY